MFCCTSLLSRNGNILFPKPFQLATTSLRLLSRENAGVIAQGKKNTITLETVPPRGTRDFFPEDMRLRNWLFGHWREVSRLFGFEEYDAPIVEHEQLYIRKAGEEIAQQLYNFEDKSGRKLSLRPEMTPSLARMIMSKKGLLSSLPIKWFSIPQCWRYERMSLGRRREHYQWNMDLWGIDGVEAEAEVLRAMVTFFTRVGLTHNDVQIKVNSREIVVEILLNLGIPGNIYSNVCVLIDKIDKLEKAEIEESFRKLNISDETITKLLQIFNPSNTIEEIDNFLEQNSIGKNNVKKLFDLMTDYGVREWFVFDPSVVRGLSYYTSIVFEAFDRKHNLRAIAGGGRYDNLLELFGGPTTPAVGFGFGDAVIIELLKLNNLLPSFTVSQTSVVIYTMDEHFQKYVFEIASKLRESSISVDVINERERKLKWVLKHSEGVGAKYLIIFGEDEWAQHANGAASVRNLQTFEQSVINLFEIPNFLIKKLTENKEMEK